MRLSRVGIRRARRGVLAAVALGLLLVLPSTAAAQDEQEVRLGFNADAGMILFQVKPGNTADFEEVMSRLKDALAASDDPVRRQQASSWKMFKSLEQNPGGNVLYIFAMDPVINDAEYDATQLINEAFPDEVQDLFAKLKEAVAGLNRLNLEEVLSMR